jgi:hypothetical protein
MDERTLPKSEAIDMDGRTGSTWSSWRRCWRSAASPVESPRKHGRHENKQIVWLLFVSSVLPWWMYLLSVRALRVSVVSYKSSDTGLGAPSTNRSGRNALASIVLAFPSVMISASNCPNAGACITPWPDEPLIR